ncbi:hypothetical protein [Brachybacterium sp. YJGR34]|uniref:hypothetical protein n=1 Tax=Brachybacterium sp. YJGR34 TaxID=2059911 RepID=UPI000E0C4AC6|nr:hypothetical protein [Brachybacterium sp. YJGR34]
MTARSETVAPLSMPNRLHLVEHRDELRELAGSLEVARDELRADALLGVPVEEDTLRLIRDAGDLLLIAARRIDPDQETRS